MIVNNYVTMKHIAEVKDEPLSPELVKHIHRLVTHRTLDCPDACGRTRREGEGVRVVSNADETVLHIPPDWSELETRMRAMCEFANEKGDDSFLHPALRAIILHFWLGYDHSFVDGNGRTARALFYWCMLHHDMWLAEFLSISGILVNAQAKYARSFLHTESDDNDLTYFIIYQLHVIEQAMEALTRYVQRKSKQLRQVDERLRDHPNLNVRQRVLLAHALRHPHHDYTIASHRESHRIVYETARTDLHNLRKLGYLLGEQIGKTWHFRPAPDFAEKLDRRRSNAR